MIDCAPQGPASCRLPHRAGHDRPGSTKAWSTKTSLRKTQGIVMNRATNVNVLCAELAHSASLGGLHRFNPREDAQVPVYFVALSLKQIAGLVQLGDDMLPSLMVLKERLPPAIEAVGQ